MNANHIINMVIRMVVRRVLSSGVNAGINAVSKKASKGKPADAAQPQGHAPESKETAKRMRQTMRIGRKIGRF